MNRNILQHDLLPFTFFNTMFPIFSDGKFTSMRYYYQFNHVSRSVHWLVNIPRTIRERNEYEIKPKTEERGKKKKKTTRKTRTTALLFSISNLCVLYVGCLINNACVFFSMVRVCGKLSESIPYQYSLGAGTICLVKNSSTRGGDRI